MYHLCSVFPIIFSLEIEVSVSRRIYISSFAPFVMDSIFLRQFSYAEEYSLLGIVDVARFGER